MPRSARDNDPVVLEGKVFAVLAYLPFFCIIPLVLKKDNNFVLAHGKQGLVIFVGEIGVFILSIVFPWIYKASMFLLLLLAFVGIIAVLRGRYIKLPVISFIADKIML